MKEDRKNIALFLFVLVFFLPCIGNYFRSVLKIMKKKAKKMCFQKKKNWFGSRKKGICVFTCIRWVYDMGWSFGNSKRIHHHFRKFSFFRFFCFVFVFLYTKCLNDAKFHRHNHVCDVVCSVSCKKKEVNPRNETKKKKFLK